MLIIALKPLNCLCRISWVDSHSIVEIHGHHLIFNINKILSPQHLVDVLNLTFVEELICITLFEILAICLEESDPNIVDLFMRLL